MVHESSAIRPHPRARRRLETVSELLDHAERVVLAEGLEALSMHRLAAEHGVRVAALYRYWPSKDALLVALLERAVGRLAEALATVEAEGQELVSRARKPWTAHERALFPLVRFAAVYATLARERPEVTSLIAHFLAPTRPTVEPAAGAPLVSLAMGLVRTVASAYDRAAACGALAPGDATQRTALTWTSLQGLVASTKLTRFGVGGDAASLTRALIAALLTGWGADAEALTRPLERGFLP